MVDFKPNMSGDDFARHFGEDFPDMKSAALALHTLLDPMDGNGDGNVSFTDIPYPELCEALRNPDFLEKIFMDKAEVVVPKGSETKLDQIKSLIRGYAKHLQTIEVDTTPDKHGNYVGLRNGRTPMRIMGLPAKLMGEMKRDGAKVVRLVIDGRSLSEPSEPMLLAEGHTGVFAPKSYISDVTVEGGLELFPNLEIDTIPYAKAGFLSGESVIEIGIGGLALATAVIYCFSGKRRGRGAKMAPIQGGRATQPVRTPRLKLPGQQMKRLQEATTQTNLPVVVMSRSRSGRGKRAQAKVKTPNVDDCQMIDMRPLIEAGIIPKPVDRIRTPKRVAPKPPKKRPELIKRKPVEENETMIMGDMYYQNGQWRKMTPQEIGALRRAGLPMKEGE